MAPEEALSCRKLHVIADCLRGYAARCAEEALPFRKLRDLFMGYAPPVRRCGKSSDCAQAARFLLNPETQGHRPEIKAHPPRKLKEFCHRPRNGLTTRTQS